MIRIGLLAGALMLAIQPACAQDLGGQDSSGQDGGGQDSGASQTGHAKRRVQISPYIDAGQVFAADLSGGDVLTYSTLGAGIDASIQTRRVEVQVSYQYEHRFGYGHDAVGDDTHSGLARGKAVVAQGVTLEGGAIATRTRADIRGDANPSFVGATRNSSQVFSVFAGPNIATHVGQAFVNAAYRFGYTKVGSPDGTGVAANQPRLDYYDDSTVHVATASVGTRAGTALPIGLTASGSYTREDAGQLSQRFEGKYGRGDAVLPVARGIALTAGVGYDDIRVSQRDALLDAAGQPVLDANGRFVTDPASPRRIAYDLSGVFWDAGVIWRPSSRTYLEARLGRRYGSISYTGSFSYKMGPGSGIQIGVYDSVESFGQQLNGSLVAMPTSFETTTDPFGNAFSGCIYGTVGSATGGCLNGVFASAVTSAYRARGVAGVAVLNRGNTRLGIGGGYARRDFIGTGTSVDGFTLNGSGDESVYAQFFASTDIGPRGQLSGSVFTSYYTSDIPGADGILGWGANAAYTRAFGHLDATISAGLFGYDRQNDNSSQAQAMLALRYGF